MARVDALLPALVTATAPVAARLYPVAGEPRPWRSVLATAAGQDCPVGQPWGAAWDSAVVTLTGTVPAGWPLADTVLVVAFDDPAATGFGAEALAYDAVSGRALGGLSPMHPWVAVPARKFTVAVEAAANPSAWGRTVPEPDPGGAPLFRLAAAHLARLDRGVLAALFDARLDVELAAADGLPGRGRLPGRAFAVGNAHIDTAWLWPYRETRRKIARTLATALALAERYPDYRFAVSQPQQLEWLRQDDPELFGRVKQAVARGQLECVGAMWVEADCNLPGGESLARQILVGQRWWQRHLGVQAREVWLPDAFGFPATLPGLLRHAGLTRFVTQKLSWNDTNRMPHHTFWWRGLDGQRVLAHFPPAATYSAQVSVGELVQLSRALTAGQDPAPALFLYGFGDGGGGPTAAMVEMARRLAAAGRLPELRLSTVGEFFDALERELPAEAPTWDGELYLEFHRGTYTTHGWLKSALRRAEAALRDAELLSVATGGRDTFEDVWRTLLLQQFHDVAPGTSIAWVNREARAALAGVQAEADRAASAGLGRLAARVDTSGCADPLLVWDGSEGGRVDLLTLAEPAPGTQPLAGGGYGLLARTPACGWATIDRARPPDPPEAAFATADTLGNGAVLARFSPAGEVVSLVDRRTGREALAAPLRLHLLADEPRHWDAWDIDRAALDAVVDVGGPGRVSLVESGPLRAAVQVVRPLGERSTVTCTTSVVAGCRRLDLTLDVDWQEEHRLLKLAVPLAVHAPTVTGEIAWGQLSWPVQPRSRWEEAKFEVCAHRWMDASEPGFGVALCNDGRFGHDVAPAADGEGVRLRLSLLRAPSWPDPTVDRGRHRIRAALVLHDGALATVRAEAAALNHPRRVLAVPARPGPWPATGQLVAVSPATVHVAAVKAAEDDPDAIVIRLVETAGAGGVVTLHGLAVAGARWRRADLLERSEQPWQPGPPRLRLGAFEIATVLLQPAIMPQSAHREGAVLRGSIWTSTTLTCPCSPGTFRG